MYFYHGIPASYRGWFRRRSPLTFAVAACTQEVVNCCFMFDSPFQLTLGISRRHNDFVYVTSLGDFFLHCFAFVSLMPGIGLGLAGTTIHDDGKVTLGVIHAAVFAVISFKNSVSNWMSLAEVGLERQEEEEEEEEKKKKGFTDSFLSLLQTMLLMLN